MSNKNEKLACSSPDHDVSCTYSRICAPAHSSMSLLFPGRQYRAYPRSSVTGMVLLRLIDPCFDKMVSSARNFFSENFPRRSGTGLWLPYDTQDRTHILGDELSERIFSIARGGSHTTNTVASFGKDLDTRYCRDISVPDESVRRLRLLHSSRKTASKFVPRGMVCYHARLTAGLGLGLARGFGLRLITGRTLGSLLRGKTVRVLECARFPHLRFR